jgi:hypothetical protein
VLENGMSAAAVGCQYVVNELMICFIQRYRDKIKGSVKISAASHVKI